MVNRSSLLLFGLLALAATSVRADGIDHAERAELSRQVSEIASRAAAPLSRMESLSPLLTKRLAGIGVSEALDEGPDEVRKTATSANLDEIRVDFMMAQLKLQTGAAFNANLREALPGPNAMALFIRSGQISLRQLAEKAKADFPGAFEIDGKTYTAHWPIIVWSDAELTLEAGERLNLSTREGVFILNSGLLNVSDATISGHGERNAGRTDFKPFIVTAMTGAMRARKASFSDLGFPGSDATSGISIIGAALFPAKTHTFFINSDFSNVGSLNLHNTRDVLVSGNRFVTSLGPAVGLKGVSHARIVSNIVSGARQTQGISLQNGTSNVEIANNIVLGNRGIGIFLVDDVRSIQVSKNLVAGNGRGGISVVRGTCVDITGNVVVENKQAGIKVRNSDAVTLSTNQLIGNAGAGISVVEQAATAHLTIDSNEFITNRSGVYGGSASVVSLYRNDFSGQSPILLDGEFAADVPRLLRTAAGQPDTAARTPLIIHATDQSSVRNDCQSGS
jgi:parallel beta-helix repeat protein